MKSSYMIAFFTSAAVIYGCFSVNSNQQELATDMCGCFNQIKDSLSSEGIRVFEKAAVADDPAATFANEMEKLQPAAAMKVNAALLSIAKPGSPVSDCLKELDQKYRTANNTEQGMISKMMTAVKHKKDCEIMLLLLRINQAKKG